MENQKKKKRIMINQIAVNEDGDILFIVDYVPRRIGEWFLYNGRMTKVISYNGKL